MSLNFKRKTNILKKYMITMICMNLFSTIIVNSKIFTTNYCIKLASWHSSSCSRWLRWIACRFASPSATGLSVHVIAPISIGTLWSKMVKWRKWNTSIWWWSRSNWINCFWRKRWWWIYYNWWWICWRRGWWGCRWLLTINCWALIKRNI